MFNRKNSKEKMYIKEVKREYDSLLKTINSGKENVIFETSGMTDIGCEIFARLLQVNHPEIIIDECLPIKYGVNKFSSLFYFRLIVNKRDDQLKLVQEKNL